MTINRVPSPVTWGFNEIPAGDDARLGVTETYGFINNVEVRRSWTGAPIPLMSPFPKKQTISYQASGKAIQGEPAFDNIQLGMQVTLYCLKTETAYIDVGQTSVTLWHHPIPGGGIYATEFTSGKRVRVTRVGKVVSIVANDDVVVLRYRPIIVAILKKYSGAAQQLEATQTWSAEFEEV